MTRHKVYVGKLTSAPTLLVTAILTGCTVNVDQQPAPTESFMTASPDHFDARGLELQQQVRDLIPNQVLDFARGTPPEIGETNIQLLPCGPSLDQDTWTQKNPARYYYDGFTVPLNESESYDSVFDTLHDSIDSKTNWELQRMHTIGDEPIPDRYWVSEDKFVISISLSRGDKERNYPDLIDVGVASPCFVPVEPMSTNTP